MPNHCTVEDLADLIQPIQEARTMVLIMGHTMAHIIILGTIQDTIQDTILPIASIYIHRILTRFNPKMIDYLMMIEELVEAEVYMEVMVAMVMFVEVLVEYSGIRMRIPRTSSVINFIFLKMVAIDTKI